MRLKNFAAIFQKNLWRGAAASMCILFFAAAVLVNQSAVHWRDNLVDSHLFGYYGWCVAHGARPYLDVWDNKPPGIWWVNALGFMLCGEGPAGEWLICAAAVAGSLCAFVAAARTAYSPALALPAAATAAALLTHLRYECGANRTETFVVLFELLAVWGYLRWRAGGRAAWLVFGGLTAGIAPLFKQSGLAAGVACGLHLLWTVWREKRTLLSAAETSVAPSRLSWRPFWIAAGGFCVAPLLAGGALLAQGALGEAWFAVGRFNRAYFEIQDASWWRVSDALRTYRPELKPLYGLFAIAGFGALLELRRCWRIPHAPLPTLTSRAPAGLFWTWFFLAVYLACIGPGRQGHHWMPTLPALGLLVLAPLHDFIKHGGLAARLAASPLAVVVLAAYLAFLVPLAEDSWVRAQQCWRTKSAWNALTRRETPGYELQAAAIQRLTRPDETIYVWGWSPGTYRLAYRRCPSRYATLEKCGQLGAAARFIGTGAVADIRRAPPAAFALYVEDWGRMQNAKDADYEFAQWLAQRYEIAATAGGMHILRRR